MRGTEAKQVKEKLQQLADADPAAIPALNTEDRVVYRVLAARGPVTLFRGSVLEPEEVITDVEGSGVWEEAGNILLPSYLRRKAVLKSPLLPLKIPHLALAIAAGAVEGNMGTHLLEGVTKKEKEITQEEDEKGNLTIRTTERHVTKIRVFSPEGVFDLG